MNNFACRATSRLLVTVMLVTAILSAAPATSAGGLKQGQGIKEFKVKRGAEVAARVKKLKERNKGVRRALATFEQNKHVPKIDESWSMSGTLPAAVARAGRGSFRNASFKETAQDVVSGDGMELILVPTLSTDTEWQGTVIATACDEFGYFLEQYVADVAMARQSSETQPWKTVYEVSFDGASAWIESDANMGMITDPAFEFGKSIYEQPELQGSPGLQMARLLDGTKFLNASFQIRSDRNFYPPPTFPSDRVPDPRWGQFFGNVGLGIVASGASCWVTGPFTPACIGGRSLGIAIMNLPLLFRSRARTYAEMIELEPEPDRN